MNVSVGEDNDMFESPEAAVVVTNFQSPSRIGPVSPVEDGSPVFRFVSALLCTGCFNKKKPTFGKPKL